MLLAFTTIHVDESRGLNPHLELRGPKVKSCGNAKKKTPTTFINAMFGLEEIKGSEEEGLSFPSLAR